MAQSGNVSKSHIKPPNHGYNAKSVARDITTTPRPAFVISFDGILQGAAAIAMGGVDTGKQYEKEHPNVAGNIRYIG